MAAHHGKMKEMRMLPHRIIYGYYPEVVMNDGDEMETLKLLTDAYLYKDILSWENIKHPDKLHTLLRALAYQIGSQVSLNELGQMCSMDSKTVERYITLLEQCYIIFRLPSYSRNLRNELKTSRKIYFYEGLATDTSPLRCGTVGTLEKTSIHAGGSLAHLFGAEGAEPSGGD